MKSYQSYRFGPFVFVGERTFGWFRIFGWGLWWKDRSRHDLRFSERNWLSPFHFAFGTWHFRFLRRASAMMRR